MSRAYSILFLILPYNILKFRLIIYKSGLYCFLQAEIKVKNLTINLFFAAHVAAWAAKCGEKHQFGFILII